jgi:hypothetical protein
MLALFLKLLPETLDPTPLSVYICTNMHQQPKTTYFSISCSRIYISSCAASRRANESFLLQSEIDDVIH